MQELVNLDEDGLKSLCDAVDAEERRREALVPHPNLCSYLSGLSPDELEVLSASAWGEYYSREEASHRVAVAHMEEQSEAAAVDALEAGGVDWEAIFKGRVARLFKLLSRDVEPASRVVEEFLDVVNKAFAKMQEQRQ